VGQDEAGTDSIERVLREGQARRFRDDPPRAISRIRCSNHGGGAIHCHDQSRWSGSFRRGGCESACATADVKHSVADLNRHHRDEIARRPHEMRRHGHAAVHVRDGGIAIG
jgi:hypothetical protein